MNKWMALMAAGVVGSCSAASAAILTWDGSNNSWDTPTSWGGALPDLATPVDEAIVNGGSITWTTANDFAQNSSFTMNGGSWLQVGVGNWIDFGIGGKTGVCFFGGGAVFDSGSAGNVFLGRGNGLGLVTVNGGTIIVTNNPGAELHIQGSNSVFDLVSGLVDINLLSFDGLSSFFNIHGGELRIHKGNIFQGIFRAAAGGRVNFVAGSTGSIFIDNLTTNDLFGILTDGRIYYDGAVSTNLVAVDEGTGVRITVNAPVTLTPTELTAATISNGLIHLTVTSLTPGTTNQIQRTLNLVSGTWEPLYVFEATGTVTNYSDPVTNSAAHYRVLTE